MKLHHIRIILRLSWQILAIHFSVEYLLQPCPSSTPMGNPPSLETCQLLHNACSFRLGLPPQANQANFSQNWRPSKGKAQVGQVYEAVIVNHSSSEWLTGQQSKNGCMAGFCDTGSRTQKSLSIRACRCLTVAVIIESFTENLFIGGSAN